MTAPNPMRNGTGRISDGGLGGLGGIAVWAAFVLFTAGALQASEAGRYGNEKHTKTQEKKKKKEEAKRKKEQEKKRKEKEKKARKKKGAPEGAPAAPSVVKKNGDPFHDYVVDFEQAFARATPAMKVARDVKHDYAACLKVARKLEQTSRKLLRVHEDRLRQFGNDYHHQLELLAINAHRLRVSVAEHHRANIFTYWQQLKLLRDLLARSAPWGYKKK